MPTKIEWCDETINPQVGCWPVSEGCKNCYAAKMAWRLQCMGVKGYEGVTTASGWTGRVNPVSSAWDKPLHWKKPKYIFVGSMTDMFKACHGENVYNVAKVAGMCPQHTFIILTKRARLMEETYRPHSVPENVYFGVSIESQDHVGRVFEMMKMGRTINVISCEPLLGPIVLPKGSLNPNTWILCGAETGPNARYCDPDWARNLRNQCIETGARFLFKKFANGETMLDGREWREFPDKPMI